MHVTDSDFHVDCVKDVVILELQCRNMVHAEALFEKDVTLRTL
jgi:hypothetical protein